MLARKRLGEDIKPAPMFFKDVSDAFALKLSGISDELSGARSTVYKAHSESDVYCVRKLTNVISPRGLNFSLNLQAKLPEHGFPYVSTPLPVVGANDLTDQDGKPMAYAKKIGNTFYTVGDWIQGYKTPGGIGETHNAGGFLAVYHNATGKILDENSRAGKTDYLDVGSRWGSILYDFPPEGSIEDSPLSEHAQAPRGDARKRGVWNLLKFKDIAKQGRSIVDDLVIEGVPVVEEAGKTIAKRLTELGFRVEFDAQGNAVREVFPVPHTIAHGDITPENLLYSDNFPVGLIDFDLAATRERVADVAWGMLMFGKRDGEINEYNAKTFLAGYEKVSPLSNLEQELIPLEMMARLCGTTHFLPNQHFERNARLDSSGMTRNIILFRENMETLKKIMGEGVFFG